MAAPRKKRRDISNRPDEQRKALFNAANLGNFAQLRDQVLKINEKSEILAQKLRGSAEGLTIDAITAWVQDKLW